MNDSLHQYPLINPKAIDAIDSSLNQSVLPSASHSLSAGRLNTHGYDSYYAKMDAVSAMKVAITTAYIPTEGAVIVDLGFGTGKTSYDLANLYPRNKVVGIDIDPHAIENAQEQYGAPNLRFLKRDFSNEIFTPQSVDVFFLSSAVHEVPSYAQENRFSPDHIQKLIAVLEKQLKPGGLIIIGDFLKDAIAGDKVLYMRTDDGLDQGDFPELSSAALFKDFIKRFHCHGFEQGGIDNVIQEVPLLRPGWTAFRGPAHLLDEFQHRRTYTKRWLDEIEEQYLHFTSQGYEHLGDNAGMRVVRISPLQNEWIVRNWWEGKFESYSLDGTSLPHPSNKVHAVYQRTPLNEGRKLIEVSSRATTDLRYLSCRYFRNEDPLSFDYGKVFEVARRPGLTLDTIIYKQEKDALQVLIKQGYPRPIINALSDSPNIDGSLCSGYITELISDISTGSPDDDLRIARERGNIDEQQVLSRHDGLLYLSSPGGVDERIQAKLLEVDAFSPGNTPHTPYSGFSTSGRFAIHDSRQLLRAYQTGDMYEPRLEVNLYHLHQILGLSPGQWIGNSLTIPEEGGPLPHRKSADILQDIASRNVFHEIDVPEGPSFLEVRRATFEEVGLDTAIQEDREYVLPKHLSINTVMMLPIKKVAGEYFVGLEVRDLPASQLHLGRSSLLTIPGFRLTKDSATLSDALEECRSKMKKHFHVDIQSETPLGMKYFPSPGITPENVRLFAVTVQGDFNGIWCPLKELVQNYENIHDLHLLVAVFRSAHALGVLDPEL